MRKDIAILLLMGAMGSGGWAMRSYSAQKSREITATARARMDTPRSTEGGTLLPSGWTLRPAGRQIPTGDLPVSMTLSPGGNWLLVSTAGYAPCQVIAIDTANEQPQSVQTLDQTWEGMAFRPSEPRATTAQTAGAANGSSASSGNNVNNGSGTNAGVSDATNAELYVSGGGRGLLWRFGWDERGGELARKEPLPVADLVGREAPYVRPKTARANAWIAGLTFSPDDGTLYVLNNQGRTLYACDPQNGKAIAQAKTGDHPNALALSPDHKRIFVTNQGGASVSVYEAGTLKKVGDVAVGKQPVALLFSGDGRRLWVANSGSDTVSVLDPDTLTVQETIRTTLFPNAPVGSTPNALALAPDGRRLFVTNADNNDVAVIDVSDPRESRVAGFIPTGWYPTTVAVSKDGKKLFVGAGKGLGSRPSFPRRGGGVGLTIYNNGPTQSYGPEHDQRVTFDYIASLLGGAVSIIDMPDDRQLAQYTAQVIANCPYRDEYLTRTAEHPAHSVLPSTIGQKSPVDHILYIIKENRTYDQVFGDMAGGEGDPNLVLFGETVTPNHHALARQFVLLDNLYCNGEVSEDGHQWCNAAFCTDWTQKVWPGNYATPSRGDANGSEAVTAPTSGYLWDSCARHGLTYRTYGEFTSFTSDRDSAPVATSGSPQLNGHISVAWEQAARQGKRRDYLRADAFIDELKQAEVSGEWPNYMVMSLGEDHTVGLTPGLPTPWASVASNDYALGKIVDAVSHSRFWPHTAIFVIEDDAQAGPDHVDAHRTVGLVISPYVRRRSIDHTFYTTSSFLRSMELLLGLPPMTQYDAGATPLFNCLGDRPDLAPYKLLEPRTDLAAITPRPAPALKSARGRAVPSARLAALRGDKNRGNRPDTDDATPNTGLDFSAYDRCDPDTLNRVLWTALKGRTPYPGPTVGARIAPAHQVGSNTQSRYEKTASK